MPSRRRLMRALLSMIMTGVMLLAVAAPAGAKPRPDPIPDDLTQRLDAELPAILERHRIPGAAVVVVGGGRQLAARGYGTADLMTGAELDPARTGLFTASVAKLFTATAALQLVEQGRLDLDRDVNDYLTGFEIADTFPGRPVTMRHLLTHTAGFDFAVLGGGGATDRDGRTLTDYLARAQPDRLRPPDLSLASYDNYGVALAGLVVEEVAGQPFERYVADRIFAPLGMDRSTQAQPQPDHLRRQLATGYRVAGDDYVAATGQYGPLTPTGAATVTTAEDMGRFMLSQLPGGHARVLDPASIRTMQTRQAGLDERLPGLGFLWELRDRNGQRLVTKSGDMPGFHTNLILLPALDVGIYVAFNGDGDGNTGWLAGREFERWFVDQLIAGDPGEPSQPTDPPSVPPAGSARFEGTYRGLHISHSEFIGAAGLVGGVTVTAEPDGSLVTTNAAPDDPAWAEQRWDPIGDRLFRERGGTELLAFSADATSLTMTGEPIYTFTELPWYESPMLHQIVLSACLAIGLAGVVGWLIAAAWRRRTERPGPPAGARIARWTAGGTVLAHLGYTGAILLLLTDGAALNETLFLGDSPLLIMVRVLSCLGLLGAFGSVIAVVVACSRRWWTVLGRIQYGLVAAAVAGVPAICATHAMVGPGLW
ncbi:serine hydrolase domain-containing protein [Microlunatus speluncae]|uniref:serine hydrolase domain-containing protein n=1 Tax=Microlunatus speluncae TaxID=2594267 RepID=UPI0013763259|nr:serine hydrolase domain-containing protein [Microlunatus speluncae]